ncbi:hypothetical protein BDK51DRAFT_35112 [Blyttiomyces helicus]|uniref:Uncharacterized protein n=1 Tax=Blyttiomyces helicus TaxID=388810 RepID=A0A4P9W002_9FUNG|nr:hypothetical protein BDK51DRAFT_35112 [Blyttiomyces helicus]|eukprot:RKO83870.1 hypothetical protein BDK51DRAFT_35112 [Blyttiomyces helicus]
MSTCTEMTYTQEEVDVMLTKLAKEKDEEIQKKDAMLTQLAKKKDEETQKNNKVIGGLRAQICRNDFKLITIRNISDDNGHSATSSTGPAARNPVPPGIGGGNVTAGTDVGFSQAVPRAGN